MFLGILCPKFDGKLVSSAVTPKKEVVTRDSDHWGKRIWVNPTRSAKTTLSKINNRKGRQSI